jgi:hypothetical protein
MLSEEVGSLVIESFLSTEADTCSEGFLSSERALIST